MALLQISFHPTWVAIFRLACSWDMVDRLERAEILLQRCELEYLALICFRYNGYNLGKFWRRLCDILWQKLKQERATTRRDPQVWVLDSPRVREDWTRTQFFVHSRMLCMCTVSVPVVCRVAPFVCCLVQRPLCVCFCLFLCMYVCGRTAVRRGCLC